MEKEKFELSSKSLSMIKIAKEILSLIPNSALSGGLSLNLQEIKTRRDPKDIDIFVPFGVNLKDCIKGIFKYYNVSDDESFDGSDNDESCYERRSYVYKSFKVDFFQPTDKDEHLNLETLIHNEINLVRFSDIIKMKIEHAFDKRYSRFKHKDDIIFMLSLIE